jgi:hypothetical protein
MASQLSLSFSPFVSWKAIYDRILATYSLAAMDRPEQHQANIQVLGVHDWDSIPCEITLILRLWEPYQAYGLRSVTPCSSVDRYITDEHASSIFTVNWRWKRKVPSKNLYQSTKDTWVLNQAAFFHHGTQTVSVSYPASYAMSTTLSV